MALSTRLQPHILEGAIAGRPGLRGRPLLRPWLSRRHLLLATRPLHRSEAGSLVAVGRAKGTVWTGSALSRFRSVRSLQVVWRTLCSAAALRISRALPGLRAGRPHPARLTGPSTCDLRVDLWALTSICALDLRPWWTERSEGAVRGRQAAGLRLERALVGSAMPE